MPYRILPISGNGMCKRINADKLALNELDPEALTKSNSKKFKKELGLVQKGELFGFKTGNEY